jgi:hypothetical protein
VMSHPYTEDHLVEQPAIGQFAGLFPPRLLSGQVMDILEES